MTNLDNILKSRDITLPTKVVWSRLWFFQWSCTDVRVGLWRKVSAEILMLLNCGVGEDSWEPLGLQGDPTSPFWRRSVLGVHCKDWCWSWNSNTLATSCKELTHWKRSWCWEGLGAGGEGDDRGLDGWMASPTRWTWVWVKSGFVMDRESWRAVIHGVAKSRTRLSDWTELNWWSTEGYQNLPLLWHMDYSELKTIENKQKQEKLIISSWLNIENKFPFFIKKISICKLSTFKKLRSWHPVPSLHIK